MSEVTKDQLDLLMSSYRESIQLNTTLIGKLDNVLDIQKQSCLKVDKLCEKIDHQTTTLIDANLQIGEKLVIIQTESIKEHSSIKNKVYIAFGMMGSIILGLITLVVTLCVK